MSLTAEELEAIPKPRRCNNRKRDMKQVRKRLSKKFIADGDDKSDKDCVKEAAQNEEEAAAVKADRKAYIRKYSKEYRKGLYDLAETNDEAAKKLEEYRAQAKHRAAKFRKRE